jgi:hypothetical protein
MAVAYEPAPTDPRLNGREYLVYRVWLTAVTRPPRTGPCRRARQGAAVHRGIRSVRLVDAAGEPV